MRWQRLAKAMSMTENNLGSFQGKKRMRAVRTSYFLSSQKIFHRTV